MAMSILHFLLTIVATMGTPIFGCPPHIYRLCLGQWCACCRGLGHSLGLDMASRLGLGFWIQGLEVWHIDGRRFRIPAFRLGTIWGWGLGFRAKGLGLRI